MRGETFRRYLFSVPERVLRPAPAVSGGLLRKLGDATLLPAIRRTAGNGMGMTGILTFRASPVGVMAALAGLSGASRHIVREVAAALREEGMPESGARLETVDQLLGGLGRTAGRAAEALNMPPLDVARRRARISSLRLSTDVATQPG